LVRNLNGRDFRARLMAPLRRLARGPRHGAGARGPNRGGRAVARKALEAFPSYNQGWIGHMVRDPALRETLRRGGKLAGLPE
jgi:hypothetical protein